MKKLLLLLLSAIVLSCRRETNAVEKPEKVLSEGDMENILYDITMMQAIRSFQPQVFDNGKVDSKQYIYKKYKIDSLTFVKNNNWYAGDPEIYSRILDKVDKRIKKEKNIVAKAIKKETAKEEKSSTPKSAIKRDSLKKVVLNRLQDHQK